MIRTKAFIFGIITTFIVSAVFVSYIAFMVIINNPGVGT